MAVARRSGVGDQVGPRPRPRDTVAVTAQDGDAPVAVALGGLEEQLAHRPARQPRQPGRRADAAADF